MDALKRDSSAFDDRAGTLTVGIYGPVDRSDHPDKYKHQSPEIPLIRESVMIPRGISYPDIDNGVLHHHPKVDKEVYLVGTISGPSIETPLDQAF